MPSPPSSTRGENASATSRSASRAERSLSGSRGRATSLGRMARDCGSVIPISMPALRAGRVAARTRAALPLPSQTTTASPFRSGSLRSRAASGKSGTERQARRAGMSYSMGEQGGGPVRHREIAAGSQRDRVIEEGFLLRWRKTPQREGRGPIRALASELLERPARVEAGQQRRSPRRSPPGRTPARSADNRVGGDAAHAVWSQEQERGLLRGNGSGETHPGGVGHEPAAARRETHVRDDQAKASRQKHLRRRKRFLDLARTHPEQARQIDAGLLGGLRIESVSQVDERRVLTAARRRRQGRDRDREPARRASSHDLHQLRSGEPQERIERRMNRQRSGARGGGRKIAGAQEPGARAGQEHPVRLFREAASGKKLLQRERL